MTKLSGTKPQARWVSAGLIFFGFWQLGDAGLAQTSRRPADRGAISAQLGNLLAAGKIEEADSLAKRYLSQAGASAQTYLEIGRVYFENDRWQRAAAFFRQSLELENKNDAAHLLLGLALQELKQNEEAERELLLAARQNPRSDTNCYMAGRVLLLEGKYESALPFFYKALELNPKNLMAYQALAQALARSGSYGLAETYDKKAIEMMEEAGLRNLEPYLDLSFLLLLGNRKEAAARALEYARRALAINPESGDAHFLSGKALLKLERYSEARDELFTAARLMPQDARPYYLLAQAYERLAEPDQARAARKTFARLNKQRADEAMKLGGVRH